MWPGHVKPAGSGGCQQVNHKSCLVVNLNWTKAWLTGLSMITMLETVFKVEDMLVGGHGVLYGSNGGFDPSRRRTVKSSRRLSWGWYHTYGV